MSVRLIQLERQGKAKNVNKECEGGRSICGERLSVDISSIKQTIFGGS
jgi:hypothetical protein